mmetsp:Transcript_5338/g.16161  ORF Transcript_5338/g.16161 Transcript_5338/m.16161 type:complete len:218 (+) Transcript_5338:804-1457(+)
MARSSCVARSSSVARTSCKAHDTSTAISKSIDLSNFVALRSSFVFIQSGRLPHILAKIKHERIIISWPLVSDLPDQVMDFLSVEMSSRQRRLLELLVDHLHSGFRLNASPMPLVTGYFQHVKEAPTIPTTQHRADLCHTIPCSQCLGVFLSDRFSWPLPLRISLNHTSLLLCLHGPCTCDLATDLLLQLLQLHMPCTCHLTRHLLLQLKLPSTFDLV